jgi:hypothetical protein
VHDAAGVVLAKRVDPCREPNAEDAAVSHRFMLLSCPSLELRRISVAAFPFMGAASAGCIGEAGRVTGERSNEVKGGVVCDVATGQCQHQTTCISKRQSPSVAKRTVMLNPMNVSSSLFS